MYRSVLITGAGRGLGYRIAQDHLALGDFVYALTHKSTTGLLELQKTFSDALVINICNLSDTAQVEAAMQEARNSDTRFDIVYNVAGFFSESIRVGLEDTDIDECLHYFNVNALGPLRVLKYVLPLLKDDSILMNVSSEAGSIEACFRSQEYAYAMSKAALNMATKTLANALKDTHIRVFAYHPGWMKTDMGGEGARLSPDALTVERASEAIMGITLHPDAIPAEVLFLDYNKQPLPW